MRISRLLFVLLLIGAAGGGLSYWSQLQSAKTEAARPQGRRAFGANDGPVAVSAAAVKTETVPIYRDGIGNAQAFALVTVKPQIDGRLTAVEFREGQEVRAGDVLARIDPAALQAVLDQTLAKKAQDQANLANARIDMARYERLAATNAGPRQQADQQKAMVAQLEAQVRADDASIDSARTNLAYTTIASPIDGRAGIRQVDAGNIVHASDPAGLVTIAQVKPISVIFTLPQRDLAVVPGALARGVVPVEAMAADGRTVLGSGKLLVVDNQVDTSTGTIKLKAVFPNDDQKLWPGQFVSVRVRVGELADALTVPTPAVRRGPAASFVYVIGADDKVSVRPVVITQQDEALTVLASGVQAGERVVTEGFPRLAEGKVVAVAPDAGAEPKPAAAPPAGQRRRNGGGGAGGGQRRQQGGPQAGGPPPAAGGAAPGGAAPAPEKPGQGT